MNEPVPLVGQIEVASNVLAAGLITFGIVLIMLLLSEAIRDRRRERAEADPDNARNMLARWRGDNPDIVEAWRRTPGSPAAAPARRSAAAKADRHAARGLTGMEKGKRSMEGDRDD
jgi:hypothetical protein